VLFISRAEANRSATTSLRRTPISVLSASLTLDAAGVDVQVLSFGSPGPQAFGADIAIPMARDANDRLCETIKAHPHRFAGFAALPTADPAVAAKELERCVTVLGFSGAMIHGHTRDSFLDEKKYWVIFECAQSLGVPIYLHETLPHAGAMETYFEGYRSLRGPVGDSPSTQAVTSCGSCSRVYLTRTLSSDSSWDTLGRACRSPCIG
jgi:predicted TIM-barrel fold metal-dependent hydrolase